MGDLAQNINQHKAQGYQMIKINYQSHKGQSHLSHMFNQAYIYNSKPDIYMYPKGLQMRPIVAGQSCEFYRTRVHHYSYSETAALLSCLLRVRYMYKVVL